MAATSATASRHTGDGRVYREPLLRLAPFVLALIFALWGLRGVRTSSIADFDSPRHALNGAFLFDMARHGELAHPVKYGYWYYSRLPALSLPYHPPVFPAFEALIFSVVGVSSFAARLSVAIATAAAVFLLFRLVRTSHGSRTLAFVVTASFFALPMTQRLSNTVMLEVPALAFVLAAALFLLPEDEALLTPRSLYFALFAVIAIWTKQTVFLFFLPAVYVAASAKWGLLRKVYFWVVECLVGASAVALALLGRELHWNGINQSWAKMSALQYVAQNLGYYFHWKVILGLSLVFLCLFTYRLPGGRDDLKRDRIYIAWLIAVLVVLFSSPAYSVRYLFFAIPPFLLLVFNGLFRVSRRFIPRYGWVIPATVCLGLCGYGLTVHPVLVRGPAEAARMVHDAGHRRILFCGNSNGAFVFAARSSDPDLETIVVRGDKLSASTFAPEQLNAFIKRYGIDSVVLERTTNLQAWDSLSAEALPFLSPERVLEMSDSDHWQDGSLSLYRVKDPTTVPKSSLQVPISVLGRSVDLQF